MTDNNELNKELTATELEKVTGGLIVTPPYKQYDTGRSCNFKATGSPRQSARVQIGDINGNLIDCDFEILCSEACWTLNRNYCLCHRTDLCVDRWHKCDYKGNPLPRGIH